jgi:hypothetical protein
VVEAGLKHNKAIAPRQANLPRLIGVERNAGLA